MPRTSTATVATKDVRRWRHEFRMRQTRRTTKVADVLEMMRYDRCTLADEADVNAIARAGREDSSGQVVEFVSFQESKDWQPTVGRWHSFGWELVE